MTRRGTRTLPLGIDVGATRVRVALVERDAAGRPLLVAVAARPASDDPGRAIAEAVAELGTRERRCVLAIATPDAHLQSIAFPPMSMRERYRAATFEARRSAAFPPSDTTVRVMGTLADGDRHLIGIARASALSRLVASARSAGLRPLAVDDAAYAFRRALPHAGAVIDVGHDAARLHVLGSAVPASHHLAAAGGRSVTDAIAGSLGLDTDSAERRKIAHGIAGVNAPAIAALAEGIAAALIAHRAAGAWDVRSLFLVGNASRLPGIADALAHATAIQVHVASLAPEVSNAIPPDVLRAAGPDWCCAYGLALWDAA